MFQNFQLLAQWLDKDNTMLGGSGKIIEIDEAKIGKRKYHRDRVLRGQWVFGGYKRDSGRIFIVPVKDRTVETLLHEIRNRIAPGSIIYSDSWRAYTNTKSYGYDHYTVNHEQNFVDPTTGCHTQNIERIRRDMRANIPRYGTSAEHYTFYIAEYLFKRLFQHPGTEIRIGFWSRSF